MSSHPDDVVDFDENVPPCTYPNLNTMTQVRSSLEREKAVADPRAPAGVGRQADHPL